MPDGTKKRVAVPALDGDASFDPTRYTAHVAQTTGTRDSDASLDLAATEPVEDRGGGREGGREASASRGARRRDSGAASAIKVTQPQVDQGAVRRALENAGARDDSQARVDGGGGGRRRHVLLQDPVVPPALCTSGPGHPGVCVTMQAPQVCVCVCVCVCVYT